jgi:hypothetical protein
MVTGKGPFFYFSPPACFILIVHAVEIRKIPLFPDPWLVDLSVRSF